MSNDKHSTTGHERTLTQTAATDMLPAGTVLAGRYRINDVIGVGAMGVVYEAHDQQLDVSVAVKLLKPEGGRSQQGSERFRREILLARQVSHPNVVRIHDMGQDGDALFLTMDRVIGRTLKERLAEGPLSVEEAASMGADVAGALAAAHDQDVVHRDLKPANILLDESGRAHVTDFGVARSMRESGLTVAGQIMGTPDYLSPEQVRGEAVDGRSDIYALGLILCEALTGRLPFSGETLEEILAQRSTGRAIDPGKLSVSLPGWMLRILRRCLARDPADRYADAKELVRDLGRGQAGRRVRRRASLGAAAAGVVTLAALLAWQLWPSFPLTDTEPTPTERIAVLPLSVEGEGTASWSGRSLAEAISATLAEQPALELVDSFRVLQLMRNLRLDPEDISPLEIRQLADLLEVSGVVHGRMAGDPERVQVELYLSDARGERVARTQERFGADTPVADAPRLARTLFSALDAAEPAHEPTIHSGYPEAMLAYDRGLEHLLLGNSVAAIPVLETAVETDPEFVLAWSRLASAYADAGRQEAAIEAAEEALGRLQGQEGRQVLWALAQHARLVGAMEEARETLEQLVADYPNDMEARVALGELKGDMGEFDRAREQLEAVTARDATHPRAWFLLGKFAIISGNPGLAAEDYLVRALVVQNRVGGPQGRGEVLNALGIAHEHLGELELAGDYYRSAVDLRDEAGDKRGLAASLSNLARLEMISGHFDSARASINRALEISQALGDTEGLADLYTELGLLEEERGDYATALSQFREALRLYRRMGRSHAVAQSEDNVAFAYLMLGEYDNAGVFANNALDYFRNQQNPRGEMGTLQTLGQLHLARGEWEAAIRSLLTALEISREGGQPFSEAAVEGSLAEVAYHQGRIAVALDGYRQAMAILDDMDDVRGMAEFSLRNAELLQWLGRSAEAEEYLARAESWLERGGNHAQLAHLARLQGRFDQASDHAERTGSGVEQLKVALARLSAQPGQSTEKAARLVRQAEQLGHLPLHLEARTLLARSQYLAGELEAAERTVRRSLRAPVGLTPWRDNWKFQLLQMRIAEARGDQSAAEQAREAMRDEHQRLMRGLSPEYQAAFVAAAVSWVAEGSGNDIQAP
ncbi:tetratricopeptide repeat protein [Gammaproteobacteria bacterium AB-CW1]|uniref:non-specific serine/threonine protein kinase n=1 Tax=Natronospira elongata TaxID=3110268 RepID=A0AAP6MJJ1_9GAMM|nr:tetratricopeptide repeat protein [Gammaproteobacteria bacterium AB-CW1]